MEVKPVPFKVRPILYRPYSYEHRHISFDGIKWYTYKWDAILPYTWTKKMDYIIQYSENDYIKSDGYYDKEKKEIWFFINPKINKLYKAIIKDQKLKRLNQTFLVSGPEKKRKRKMPLVSDWVDEYGQSFLNHENVKRNDKFNIVKVEVMEHEAWSKPRIVATLTVHTVHSKSTLKEDIEYLAGLGKKNLARLIEEFETDDENEWLGKQIEVAVIETYQIGGQKNKGIIWAVAT